MIRMIFKVALVLIGIHLLFGAVMWAVDSTHGTNDQDFSFALAIMFYYLNFSGAWLITQMGLESSIGLLVLTGLPQWIVLSVIVGVIANLFQNKKTKHLLSSLGNKNS